MSRRTRHCNPDVSYLVKERKPVDIYERATAIWLGLDPEDVVNIEFSTIEEGFCET